MFFWCSKCLATVAMVYPNRFGSLCSPSPEVACRCNPSCGVRNSCCEKSDRSTWMKYSKPHNPIFWFLPMEKYFSVATCLSWLVLSCVVFGVFSQDSRTIRHAWAPSANVGSLFSWKLQWKGLDLSGQASLQSDLPSGASNI